MTKDELEALAKDCIQNHTHRLVDKPTKQDIYLREESIFIQGYRQSEKRITEFEKENAELKAQIEKMKYALNKIIKTVQNDSISGYGDRLVIIYDISCEVLQEIKENE